MPAIFEMPLPSETLDADELFEITGSKTADGHRTWLDLNRWKSQFRPGDRIIVDIKTVTRNTFTGEQEPVAVVSGTINIPIQ